VADVLAKLRDRRLRATAARLPTTRTCEGCDLCCTAVGVHEINKAAGEACQYLAGEPGRSCSRYPLHPLSCRQFFCVWRSSDHVLPPGARPADAGWVMSINDPTTFPMVVTVHPDPARPDAWRTAKNVRLFLALADAWNCMIAVGQGKLAQMIYGPMGHVVDKATSPDAFFEDGSFVGLPGFCFHPDRRPPVLRVAEVRFNFRNYE
jgi:hypothetical protein